MKQRSERGRAEDEMLLILKREEGGREPRNVGGLQQLEQAKKEILP